MAEAAVEPHLLTIRQVRQLLNLSHATFFRRIHQFDVVKIGRRTMITNASVERFLESLPKWRPRMANAPRRRHPSDEPEPAASNPPGLGGGSNSISYYVDDPTKQYVEHRSPSEATRITPEYLEERLRRFASEEWTPIISRIDALDGSLESDGDHLSEIQERIEQLDGQLRNLEARGAQLAQMVEEHRNAIITYGQRLDVLARSQLQINARATALQMAVQSKAAHETAERVVNQAEQYYRFLLRDIVPQSVAAEESAGEPVANDPPTTH